MRFVAPTIFFLAAMYQQVSAQTFTSSNLPIVIISTDGGVSIPDNPRVSGTMKIIYRGPGQRNYLTDQNNRAYLNYDGRINIEIRGSSSQYSQKKQYGFSTLMADNTSNNNVALLGMPPENDWILNSMVFDSALIRDYLNYNLSRMLGQYASRTEYCEVLINGSYRGLYLLQEKIKADRNRVDVMRITPADLSQPYISGGYITKADKTTGNDPVAWTMTSWNGQTVNYIHHLPDPLEVNYLQTSYIKSQFTSLETAAMNNNLSLSGGIPSIIDIPSFIDFMIISELGSNADAYQISSFFHKDRNGKLRAGPVWDNDLTYGNDLFLWGLDRSKPDVWQFQAFGNDGSRFWRDLFRSAQFRCYLARRWNQLTQPGQPLNLAVIEALIDNTVAYISEALVRENTRWNNVRNHAQRIAQIKSYLRLRIPWITSGLGSYSACIDVSRPPLVINRIMYKPPTSLYYPESNSQEFIEILNNGGQPVNLSGIYFGGTGLVYQFPYNSFIAPDTSYFIASNAEVFASKYGVKPFGEYTRHLSDKGQGIILSDGFGNIIDSVHYTDTLPWPDADGNGYYLQLVAPSLDNSLASSWKASRERLPVENDENSFFGLEVSPNPASDIIRIWADLTIASVNLYDFNGRIRKAVRVASEFTEMNVADLAAGIYFMEVIISGQTKWLKIVRR